MRDVPRPFGALTSSVSERRNTRWTVRIVMTPRAVERDATTYLVQSSLTFDAWGNLTRPDGSCMLHEYGARGRLSSPDLGGFPTLRVHDAAGRLETVKEAFGGAGVQTHRFTYDHLRRPLTAQYQGSCLLSGGSRPEIESSYDALPAGVACPAGVGCARTEGRLAIRYDGSLIHYRR